MIWRFLGGAAGLGVVGTATHLNVMHAGGYQSTDAPLIIAVAVLVSIGMGLVTWAWGEGRPVAALLLGLLLLVGESYWVLTNADRELVARQAQTAPIADAQRSRTLAEKRMADAQKAKLDTDVRAEKTSAERDCKTACTALLMAAQKEANAELAAARAAFQAAKIPGGATALAANLGIEQWQWDLFVAALRSAMIAAGALAFAIAIHPRRRTGAPAPVAPVFTLKPRDNVVPMLPKVVQICATSKVGDIDAFMLVSVIKGGKSASVSWAELYLAYRRWCDGKQLTPVDPKAFGARLDALRDELGLRVRTKGNDVYFLEIQLAS